MEHIKRNERLTVLAQILMSAPNSIHNYSEFCNLFSTAKSTVSEDIDLLAEAFAHFDKGMIETIAGAAGGVRYRPVVSGANVRTTLESVCARLSESGRLLPGGYLYTSDIASDPVITESLGNIIASKYYNNSPDFVLTMETKGIPLALMTARALGVRLVVARRDSKVYEGSAVKINYSSGRDSEHVETMALARRAVKEGERALIIDDFAKGGGTLHGMRDMMREFGVYVCGTDVLIATAECAQRMKDEMTPLMILDGSDKAANSCKVVPNLGYIKAEY